MEKQMAAKKSPANKKHTLTLDVCFEDANELLRTLARMTECKVAYKVLQSQGPGGGWPEIEVHGTREGIMASLPGYFWTPDNQSVDTFEFHAGLEE
jgi:hypothetical protein